MQTVKLLSTIGYLASANSLSITAGSMANSFNISDFMVFIVFIAVLVFTDSIK